LSRNPDDEWLRQEQSFYATARHFAVQAQAQQEVAS